MSEHLTKPSGWRAGVVTVIPITSGAKGFCFIEPLFPPSAWPDTWPDDAILLDIEPAWTDGRLGPQLDCPIRDQNWPDDTIDLAQRMGCAVSVDAAGVPWVGRDVVAFREGVDLHDLYLAFPRGRQLARGADVWRDFRRRLHGIHLKDLSKMPDGCETILYVTEADMGFMVTLEPKRIEEWINGVLATEFPQLRQQPYADRLGDVPLGRWIIQEADRRGVRLRSVTAHTGQGSVGGGLRVQGYWGRDDSILAHGIGIESNEPVDTVVV